MFTSMSPLLLKKVQVKDYFQREALLMFVCVLQVLLFLQEEEEESSPETQMKKRENPWSLCQNLFFFLSLSPCLQTSSYNPLLFPSLSHPLTLLLCCWGSCSLPWVGWTGWTTGQQNMLAKLIYWLLLLWADHRETDRVTHICCSTLEL